MTTRAQFVQGFLDFYNAPRYLEVGVNRGATFHALRAAQKVAVDPRFLFGAAEHQPGCTYHEVPSDAYFATLDRTTPPFDVIYLDGLHSFEQTLRDLMSAILHLQPLGVIVIDDVIPSGYLASLPDVALFERAWHAAGATGDISWMGDVFRLVFFIESFLPDFAYATLADNHGQLAMWRGRRRAPFTLDRRVEDITRLQYHDVLLQRSAFNLMGQAAIVAQAHSDLFG